MPLKDPRSKLHPIEIAIYGKWVSVLWFTDAHKALKQFTDGKNPNANYNGMQAFVLHEPDENGIMKQTIYIKYGSSLGDIVHECLHVAFYMLDSIGHQPTADDDEPLAYLLEYLVDQVMKIKRKYGYR